MKECFGCQGGSTRLAESAGLSSAPAEAEDVVLAPIDFLVGLLGE